ncbi:MAG: hypothetical protein GWO24_37130, partial [Akkermansiaceae bacterium]|nr:hypothetical protein [Akkermansiaceae bacterium]NIV25561.1 hypothetical protein [Gemmatimonadota bacterium]NIW77645.1 hypothetical protein [Gemmatimonadota bacterium]
MKPHLARIVLGAGFLTALTSPSAPGIFLWYEDFETDGNGTRYTISGGKEYYAGVHHYCTRIRDVNAFLTGGETPDIALDADDTDEYQWFSGQWYFAAANLVGGDFRIFDWPNINIDPHFNVVFDADFAAGDTDSDPSYNLHHYIAVL